MPRKLLRNRNARARQAREIPGYPSGDEVGVLEQAPDVDHRLAPEIGMLVALVRGAQDQDVAALDDLVERKQLGIDGHEGIGGQNLVGEAVQDLLELVAQRR